MAGMLPGVESARRRRFHQKTNHCYGSEPSPVASGYGGACPTRRSSLCLYVSSHDFHLGSSTSSTPRSHMVCDEIDSRLGAVAREAKKRLDERLWRLETTRSKGRAGSQVEKVKKSGSKRLKWLKMSWRSSEQEECPVCLEQIKTAAPETLMQLRCGHRFHGDCLLPWLEANAHCPCCRMEIPTTL